MEDQSPVVRLPFCFVSQILAALLAFAHIVDNTATETPDPGGLCELISPRKKTSLRDQRPNGVLDS